MIKEDGRKAVDKKGQRFGRLVVIRRLSKTKHGHLLWLCKCDCGKIRNATTGDLNSGDVKSCGCLYRLNEKESIKNQAFVRHLWAAKSRGIKSYLTRKQYISIGNKPCCYCGCFSIRKNYATDAVVEFNSVDRKNNERFYKLSNAQSVCFVCQHMKWTLPHKEFVERIKRIIKYVKQN